MIIGIDIDDTLLSSSESFEEIVKKYNLNFKKKFKDKWTEEEKKFIFSNYLEETLKTAKFKEGAKEVLSCLKSLGYNLIIITARSDKYCKGIEEFTKEFIKKEELNVSEIYFGHSKKSDLAKELKIDLMIDDNEFVYNNMKKEKIDCILFGNEIKTWKEVLKYIQRKERKDG